MAVCRLCGFRAGTVSARLGFCGPCLRDRLEEIRPEVAALHAGSRAVFGLPPEPPRTEGGLICTRCANLCRLGIGERGYCGLRENQGGEIRGGDPDSGRLSWYFDPLPTNCVADWVCAGGSGSKQGQTNLAVFYRACSFNCLFCQNWHFKEEAHQGPAASAVELAGRVSPETACICFFGGDPTPQVAHSLEAARLARKARGRGILRICWETNGSVHPRFVKEMVALALDSGGCLKFDLKADSPSLHWALCGAEGRRTRANFRLAARYLDRRPDPPLLIASTLLVPGYVGAKEVEGIAAFLAGLNPDIPYALLAFHPCHVLDDLPRTSRQEAEEALEAALAQGLTRVRLGNVHLLH